MIPDHVKIIIPVSSHSSDQIDSRKWLHYIVVLLDFVYISPRNLE